uniref:SGNH hydrolase-type esterase domain-containing protein n=1 Tax=Globisporangium ultimum (strain ATCC 200006 / CBS 805.95 / DAOM BR144) TaxID=431595 RepID=K3XAX9_GLOUD
MSAAAAPHKRPLFYFIGDSLTQDGGNPTNGGWATLLQHKYIRSIDAINRGLSGYNTKWFVKHALPALEQELATEFSPSFVTLWLGANDAALLSGSEAYQHVPVEDYHANIALILRALKAKLPAHAKILLITPPAVIDATRLACSATDSDLDRSNEGAAAYARACVDIGKTEQTTVLDLHTFFNATYPDESARAALFSDGLHFSAAGNNVVAQQIVLKLQEIYGAAEFARLDAWQLPNWRDFIGS